MTVPLENVHAELFRPDQGGQNGFSVSRVYGKLSSFVNPNHLLLKTIRADNENRTNVGKIIFDLWGHADSTYIYVPS